MSDEQNILPGEDLTDMARMFCREYVIDMNAKEAAIRAGYKPDYAGQQGYQLMQKENIKTYIEHLQSEQMKKLNISAARVLQGFAEIAFDKTLRPQERQQALNSLARHFGMFNDKMQLSADGFVINIKK